MQTNRFPETKWTLIRRAGHGDSKAFRELYEAYWFPVFAFFRRSTRSEEDTRDLTQAFFASLDENKSLATVDRDHGNKFRTWLCTCLKNHAANKRKHDKAQKRDPGQPIESLDAIAAEGRYWAEPTTHLTPEQLFERTFALNLLARVLDLLRIEEARKGKEAQFDALKGHLSNDAETRPHKVVAAELGMKENAVKTASSRLCKRFRALLRTEVASLLTDPDEDAINEELRQLLAALEQ